MKELKIWHIGDTHGYHRLLKVPEGIDIVIHSGDHSNYYDVYKNEPETKDFIQWYCNLDIKYKVLIAGNHDALACLWNTKFKEMCEHHNLIYLENSSIEIEGIKIWGSPYSPTFGRWHFMKNRSKLDKVWQQIPEDADIVVTHTPPKGILDLTYNYDRKPEMCGCSALKKRLLSIKPKLNLFGHIHNYKDIINAGTTKLSIMETIFSNGSVVTDREFGKVTSNGNILTITK